MQHFTKTHRNNSNEQHTLETMKCTAQKTIRNITFFHHHQYQHQHPPRHQHKTHTRTLAHKHTEHFCHHLFVVHLSRITPDYVLDPLLCCARDLLGHQHPALNKLFHLLRLRPLLPPTAAPNPRSRPSALCSAPEKLVLLGPKILSKGHHCDQCVPSCCPALWCATQLAVS